MLHAKRLAKKVFYTVANINMLEDEDIGGSLKIPSV